MAAIPPAQDPLQDVHALLTMIGISDEAKRTIMIEKEGFTSPAAFATQQIKDISSTAKRMASRSRDEDRVIMGSVIIKNFEALVWWVRDKIRRGQDIVAAEFTADAMAKAMEEVIAFKIALDMKDTVELVKFKGTENWTDAKESFDNKLEATFGANDAPLSYVARDEISQDYEFADDQERLKYEIQLQGQAYLIDNRRVYRMLKEWLAGTDGWTYIREFDRTQDGRRAVKALKAHYDGEGESLKRIAIAKKQIEDLYYKSEQALNFQQYTTKLKEALLELDKDDDERLTGKQKVENTVEGHVTALGYESAVTCFDGSNPASA